MTNIVKLEQEVQQYGYSQDELDILRNTVCGSTSLTDGEFSLFLYNCHKSRLDPMRRQIYAMKTKGRMVILTSIDGFRTIAERTGNYAPGKATTFWHNDKGFIVGAMAFIKKLTKDGTWHEVSESALMSEYDKGTYPWKTMPHVMLSKVAESRALRRAFPDNLCNLYTDEELGNEKDTIIDVNVKNTLTDDEVENIKQMLDQSDPLRATKTKKRLDTYNSYHHIPRESYVHILKYLEEG